MNLNSIVDYMNFLNKIKKEYSLVYYSFVFLILDMVNYITLIKMKRVFFFSFVLELCICFCCGHFMVRMLIKITNLFESVADFDCPKRTNEETQ